MTQHSPIGDTKMGAVVFYNEVIGKSAKEAFENARENALYANGHGGYTGTIGEKNSFVMIDFPKGKEPYQYADELIDAGDSRIEDKWGPAGCFKLAKNKFYFFGWASC
jgi:hypothetical protein